MEIVNVEMEKAEKCKKGQIDTTRKEHECQQLVKGTKRLGTRKKLITDYCGTRFLRILRARRRELVLVLHHCDDKECFYSVASE